MKSLSRVWLAASLSAALVAGPVSGLASAITVEAVPNPRSTDGWVSDRANIISLETEARLNQELSELESQTGNEMAVVTVEDTVGYASPKAFVTDLFNYWGVGKAEENNGVLFLVSVGDRRTEVEVGYGLEDLLTKSKIEALLEREALPDFKQGRFDAGIEKTTRAIVVELSENRALEGRPPLSSASPSALSALSDLSGRTSLLTDSNGVKLFFFGTGAIALLFYRYGRKAFLRPMSIAPGSKRSFNGRVDPRYLRVQLSSILPAAAGGFSLGGMAAILLGWGLPFVSGAVVAAPLAALAFLQSRKKVEAEERALFCCEQCDSPLESASIAETTARLSKAQQVAERLGSMNYAGWKCPVCKKVAVRGTKALSHYKFCPRCQERTLEVHSDKTPATYSCSGEVRTHKFCHCCDHTSTTTRHLPQLTHTESSSYSGSSYSGGSSSGSSGGFGGGSSGGGGGGGSW